VRRALVWLGGALGLAALYRMLKRRGAAKPPPGPDPAEELRRTLAETRAQEAVAVERPAEPEVESEPEAEPKPSAEAEPRVPAAPEAEPEPDPASIEERRRRIHERAQEAIDAMREPPAD